MFFSKSKGPQTTDVIYLNENGFVAGINEWIRQHPEGKVVVWFQQDMERLRGLLHGQAGERFVLADRLSFHQLPGVALLFAGHYPLHAAEVDLCDNLGLNEMRVYAHLGMPLLRMFGSEKIAELMVKMGMQEDEPLNHAMITRAIGQAQEKIAKKCSTDMHAVSEEEWLRANAGM